MSIQQRGYRKHSGLPKGSPKRRKKDQDYYRKNREAILARKYLYYQENREKIRAYMQEYHKLYPSKSAQRNKAKLKEFLRKLKDGKKCFDCKMEYPHFMLDYDHVKGKKKFSISSAVRKNVSFKLLKEEIKKCQLVCSNCHRLRTFERIYEASQASN